MCLYCPQMAVATELDVLGLINKYGLVNAVGEFALKKTA